MKRKIQRSMVFVLTGTLILFYILLAVLLYNRNLQLLQSEVQQEARYIRTAINISGTQYLEKMDEVDLNTRVTRIDKNGAVLYDSRSAGKTEENHK